MQALSSHRGDIQNLSDSDDTRLMQSAIGGEKKVKDIGHAGTAMRFLTAFYAVKHGKVILTGSQRMKQRPLGPLVQALRELGTEIRYLEKEGFPPLEIHGGPKKGGSLTVDGGISSQFISALMMIGPLLEGGLNISLTGDVVSSTYVRMTLELMRSGGIDARFSGKVIHIPEGNYSFGPMEVESDWSSASYWYQVAVLRPGSEIVLPRLKEESLQGDSVLKELFAPLGVESTFGKGNLVLRSNRLENRDPFFHDFTGCPDLVQTMTATLCAMGRPFRITGTRTLRIKETDRINALQAELGKLGFMVHADKGGDWLSWDGSRGEYLPGTVIETYHDHRMAMAFAPLSLSAGPLTIEDPHVVTKSYPNFWEDLKKAGFTVHEVL
jgi:3-phosphoshikimate 1-carboxyvinyltransferase